jgi:hypothetical protein
MTAHNRISALIVAVALGFPAAAASAQNPIAREQIAAALSSAGMNATPEQVVLLTNVVATTRAPALKVESAELWSDHRIKVRLSCVRSEECLPFFVAVRGSQPQAVSPVIADASPAASLPAKPVPDALVIRSGGRAILLIEGDHIHIQLPVICLQNGAVGQTIRVTSLDHRETYAAQVDENGTLRGRLQ